jgi:hypothetical protein
MAAPSIGCTRDGTWTALNGVTANGVSLIERSYMTLNVSTRSCLPQMDFRKLATSTTLFAGSAGWVISPMRSLNHPAQGSSDSKSVPHNDARTAIVGEVSPCPVEQNHQAIAKTDEKENVRRQPETPGERTG